MIMYSDSNPTAAGHIRKAVPCTAIAFFLCFAGIASAQLNISDSNLYNGSSNAVNTATIVSSSDGAGNLDVFNPVTTAIELNNVITGYISISNGFDSMDITGFAGADLTGEESPALSVYGGTNLTLTGGIFSGGETSVFSNDWRGGIGGLISGVQTAKLSNVQFNGGRVEIDDLTTGLPPIPGDTNSAGYQTPVAQGGDALYVEDTYLVLSDNPILQGGAGGTADSSKQDVFASGGMGLTLINSTGVISNGTYKGGAGGTASATGFNGFANGGHGVFASNSTVTIHAGTFTGGTAGTVNGKVAAGGAGLTAIDRSSLTISNGTFSGASSAPALALKNSDLSVYGGIFSTGGIYSETTGNETNKVSLISGTIGDLNFRNATSNGIQFVTSSNAIVFEVFQQGGTVAVNNLADDAFQQVEILNGSMIFSNDFTLASGGKITLLDGNSVLHVQNIDLAGSAALDVGTGSINAAGTLTAESGSTIALDVISTDIFGTLTAGSAVFESNATIRVDASLAGFGAGSVTNTILMTTGGITGDFTNGVVLDVRTGINTNIAGRTTLSGTLVSDDLALVFSTASLSNYWNATGQLAELADELDSIDNASMNTIINNIGASASKTAVQNTYFTSLNTFQTAMLGLQAAVGQSVSRGTEFRDQLRLPQPTGVRGPSEPENDWRFWAKYYGQFYNHDAEASNPAYEATLHGGVIGMDKSFGCLLIGISGGMGNYRIEDDNNAEQKMNAAHGALYSTIGLGHSYIDAGIAYGFNKVDSRTAAPFVLDGEFDTETISGYIGGGLGLEIPKIAAVITPEISAQYALYEQEAYTETSTVAVPRSFEEFDADSLRTSAGVNAAFLNTTALETFSFKVEGRAHWLHEFNPDPGSISFQLQGGGNDYVLAYPMLDEDAVKIGFGFSFFNTTRYAEKNVLLRLDFDELFGDGFNSHNISAKVIYAF